MRVWLNWIWIRFCLYGLSYPNIWWLSSPRLQIRNLGLWVVMTTSPNGNQFWGVSGLEIHISCTIRIQLPPQGQETPAEANFLAKGLDYMTWTGHDIIIYNYDIWYLCNDQHQLEMTWKSGPQGIKGRKTCALWPFRLTSSHELLLSKLEMLLPEKRLRRSEIDSGCPP